MNSKFLKVALVLTSMGPFFLTFAIAEMLEIYSSEPEDFLWHFEFPLVLIILTLLCVWCTNFLIGKVSEVGDTSVSIEEVKSTDNEILSYIIIYLLPLFTEGLPNLNLPAITWIAILFFVVVFTTNTYHFSPLLSFIGYRFYDVKLTGGTHCVLITTKDIVDASTVKRVKKISSNMIYYK